MTWAWGAVLLFCACLWLAFTGVVFGSSRLVGASVCVGLASLVAGFVAMIDLPRTTGDEND